MKELPELVDPLCRLHDWLRDLVIKACEERPAADLSRVVDHVPGDVTYAIDRASESALVERLAGFFVELSQATIDDRFPY